MGGVFSNPESPPPQPALQNGTYGKDITITGLGTQWPSVTLTSDEFEKFALSLYPADSDAPWWVKVQWILGSKKVNANLYSGYKGFSRSVPRQALRHDL